MAYFDGEWDGNCGVLGIADNVGGGKAISPAFEFNSLSANAFRLRIRSFSGDAYIGYRL